MKAFKTRRLVMRRFCGLRGHARWARESMLFALASGHSARCRWCNRLVLKTPFREEVR